MSQGFSSFCVLLVYGSIGLFSVLLDSHMSYKDIFSCDSSSICDNVRWSDGRMFGWMVGRIVGQSLSRSFKVSSNALKG